MQEDSETHSKCNDKQNFFITHYEDFLSCRYTKLTVCVCVCVCVRVCVCVGCEELKVAKKGNDRYSLLQLPGEQ